MSAVDDEAVDVQGEGLSLGDEVRAGGGDRAGGAFAEQEALAGSDGSDGLGKGSVICPERNVVRVDHVEA